MKAINESNAAHYKWGDSCDGWHFLQTNDLAVIKEKMPPHTAERLHYHEKARQFFFILSGEAVFEIEGKRYKAAANEGMHIEPKAKHKIINESGSDLKFIVISQPESHGDRVNL
ncbi:MAG TPA: cupin domain-containing protein [Ignavibacteriales bacterium]|nr:cupin domain-containing protein [Ignavibacteriales bacterium]HEX3072129.1 cupin domain-containing protein [Ignavibacteriales bacterium]